MQPTQIKDPVNVVQDYSALSLLDIMRARELYHLYLTERKGVLGTALGRYLIRKEDSWPNDKVKHRGSGPKTLQNTEIRSYSWPCVLVFVEKMGQGYGLRTTIGQETQGVQAPGFHPGSFADAGWQSSAGMCC